MKSTAMKTSLQSVAPVRQVHAFAGVMIVLACAILNSGPVGATTYELATTNLLEGPATGNGSAFLVVSPPTDSWTATTNASWLHLKAASGVGSASVAFMYDGNPGTTRSGTITIAGQLLTITQAGTNYTAAPEPATALVSSGLNLPVGVAVDKAGNVYIADANNSAIEEWTLTNNSMTTLISNGLSQPYGVAVDSAGNVYIADSGNSAIKRWSPADNSITTLVSGLGGPFGLGGNYGIAVDAVGNVYFSEFYNYPYVATNNFVKEDDMDLLDALVVLVARCSPCGPWAWAPMPGPRAKSSVSRSSSAPRRELRSLARKTCGHPVRGRGREAISARLDGERHPVPGAALEMHLGNCQACRDFEAEAVDLGRRAGLRSPRAVPADLLAMLVPVLKPAPPPHFPSLRRRRWEQGYRPGPGAAPLSGRGQSCRRCLCLSHSRWDWAHSHVWSQPVRRHRARSASSHGTYRPRAEARFLPPQNGPIVTTGASRDARSHVLTNFGPVHGASSWTTPELEISLA